MDLGKCLEYGEFKAKMIEKDHQQCNRRLESTVQVLVTKIKANMKLR